MNFFSRIVRIEEKKLFKRKRRVFFLKDDQDLKIYIPFIENGKNQNSGFLLIDHRSCLFDNAGTDNVFVTQPI